jgi:DNA-binding protein HU-beta
MGHDQADLIESLATKLDLQKTLAERIVNTMFDDIESALQKGDKVNISGFGTFAVSARKARQGRNPKTGETIEIPASKSAKFKAGKSLKDKLN